MASNKEHWRHCIRFAFQLKKIQLRRAKLFAQPHGKEQRRIKRVKIGNGDFDLSDRKRPGQPNKFEDEELEQRLDENSFRRNLASNFRSFTSTRKNSKGMPIAEFVDLINKFSNFLLGDKWHCYGKICIFFSNCE